MRAVWSSEPLTKRRPSGSSARQRTASVWCLKVRRTAPSLTLKSLTVLSRGGERVLVVGQRHEGDHRARVQLPEGVLEGAVEEPHADGAVVRRAAEEALAVGHRRHRVARRCARVAGAHEALGGDAPHLDELIIAPLMMCWPSGVIATAFTPAGVPLEGVDERPVDVVQPDVALVAVAKADHKVHAVGQRRDVHQYIAATFEGALERAVERPQLRGAVGRAPAEEARSARQHRHRPDPGLVCLDGAPARAVAPHLDVGQLLTVPFEAGDDAAVGRRRHAQHLPPPGERHDLAAERPPP